MGKKEGIDKFLEFVPALEKFHNVILLSFFQIVICILLLIFFWYISSLYYFGALLGQFIISTILVFFYIYLANNAEKIRDKYLDKYGKLACQKYWFHYHSYTVPIIFVVFILPLFLINYDFLPFRLISMPSHFITDPILPFYISVPFGFFVIIFGFRLKRFSGGYGMDVDDYLYTIHPEKSRLITHGMYKYVRNPQYLSRGIISIGFGIFANNLSAILVGFIHFISYCAIMPAEDKELQRRFGNDFVDYCNKVPAVFPRFGNWIKFLRYSMLGKKNF